MLSEQILNKQFIEGFVCKACNTKIFGYNQFVKHITEDEKLTEQEYFDRYIKPDYPNEGICRKCGKPTKFVNCTGGYDNYCSTFCDNNDFGANIERNILL